MNKKEVFKVIGLIEDAYDETFDDERLGRWERALVNEDAAGILKAAESWIESETWTPKPKDLIQMAPARKTGGSSGETRTPGGALLREGKTERGDIVAKVAPGIWMMIPHTQPKEQERALKMREESRAKISPDTT